MFRDLVLEDGSVGEAECRANITAKNMTCNDEVCEQCTAQCTYPSAGAVASVARCTVARDQLSFTHCKLIPNREWGEWGTFDGIFAGPCLWRTHARRRRPSSFCPTGLQTTDAGQLARASHGAIRSENYIAV